MQTYATRSNKSLNIVACCWPIMLPFVWAKTFDRFQTIRNKNQQVPTLIVVVPCKRTQHMLGPKMLRAVGQQFCMVLNVWLVQTPVAVFARLSATV